MTKNTLSSGDNADKKSPEIPVQKTPKKDSSATQKAETTVKEKPQKAKNNSKATALAVLAIILSLGLGAGAYYVHHQQETALQQEISQLHQQVNQLVNEKMHNGAAWQEIEQKLNTVAATNAQLAQKVQMLGNEVTIKDQAINALQTQINRLNSGVGQDKSSAWKVAQADYLLKNASNALLVNKDIPTAIGLLRNADRALANVDDANVLSVRTAINRDLKTLLSLTPVDTQSVMMQLTDLAGQVDDLMLLDLRKKAEKQEVTESVKDWKANLKRSATSFLNNFVRATPKDAKLPELLTPEQEINLRENLRLRLQIALMAASRQEQGLYEQSLGLVYQWVNAYFDPQAKLTQNFLSTVKQLQSEQIAVAIPKELGSLDKLTRLLDAPAPTAE